MKNSRILYISYTGILEPLGQSQVLRYLELLADDHQIFLISFEKAKLWQNADERQLIQNKLCRAGILWRPLRYHRWPSALATAFDIVQGLLVGSLLVRRNRIRIIHARSYVPSVIALVLKKIFRCRFLFDMRGFWVDERVADGAWSQSGMAFSIAKWFERWFLNKADVVVSVTDAAVTKMKEWPCCQQGTPRFYVVPTCTDLSLFVLPRDSRSETRNDLSFTLGYVGSVGGRHLFDEVLRAFKILQELCPEARFHIFNHGQHRYIRERLTYHGIDFRDVIIESGSPEMVARAMRAMDAGVFFYKQTVSAIATAPTKFGEFLACGVPCLSNSGVGDVEKILREEQVGVTVDMFSSASLRSGLSELLELTKTADIGIRCANAAHKYYSLHSGVERYRKIYAQLSSPEA